MDGLDKQRIDINSMGILGIGNGGTKGLVDQPATLLRQEFQDGQGFVNLFFPLPDQQRGGLYMEKRVGICQPLALPSLLSFHFRLLIPSVTVKGSGWRKLTEFMPHHILRNKDGNEFLSIVNGKRHPNEFRDNGRPSRPRLDDSSIARILCFEYLLHDVLINEWSLF